MSSPISSRLLPLTLPALVFAALVWQSTWADKPAQPLQDNQAKPGAAITTKTLGGPQRFLTQVSTDKPIYRPGETIYMRGVVLHHADRTPLDADKQVSALVEIQGPKGDTAASGYVASQDSVLGYSWTIPDGQAGGQYTLRVNYPGEGFAPAERTFDIRSYRPPRLKSQINFVRDGYGPGDTVMANLEVKRAEGGVPADAKVTVVARVDGQETYRGTTRVDEEGNCQTRFQLPEQIQRGEGTLAMVIEDGGVVETASKTIPILLQTVDLSLFPEGGDLVAGLPNRVYFEAFTPAGKPADLAGIVVDAKGNEVAKFRSQHEGRGRFTLTPQKDGRYALKIIEPAGIRTEFPLPDVKPAGVVLRADKQVYAPGERVSLSVGCQPVSRAVVVTLSQRERQIASAWPKFQSGDAGQLVPVAFDLPERADGVLIATVWDKQAKKPLAERLIFRQPAGSVRVAITADADRYVPGGKAKLTVKTTDQSGQPISAVVGLTVTDDAVLEMIERREQAPQLPVMVLLENEVSQLADAHVYLDPDNPLATTAVDLLLGTQGWRRFVLVRSADILQQHGDAARRALALRMNSTELLKSVVGNENGQGEVAAFALDDAAGLDGAPVDAAVPEAANEDDNDRQAPDAQPVPNAPPAGREALERQDRLAQRGDADGVAAGPAADAALAAQPVREQAQALKQLQEPASKEERQLRGALDNARRAKRKNILADAEQELVIRNDFVAVRVFAHQVRPDRQPGQRSDFTETLFWNAGIKTDAKTGEATVEMDMNDAVTSFRVLADAFSADGALGNGNQVIESVEPFYVEPKLPLEVTSGDTILLPLSLVNATDSPLTGVRLDVQAHAALSIASPSETPKMIDPQARLRNLISIQVGAHNGAAEVTLNAKAGPYGDQVTRNLTIRPQGFPVEVAMGGVLGPGATATHDIEIPQQVVAASTTARVVVYPTPLANMTEALERLIQEPYGCFEQTSSSTYPLVMAQQYFMSHQGVEPSLVERSAKLLDKGYQRLIGFECKGHGFEWFGEDPGHEALSAYGLLEFTDMAQVYAVDSAMLERTRSWLLATRDGKGGFARKRRALHTWITEPEVSDAYITWALLEAGMRDELKKEVAAVGRAGESSLDTYVIALAANVAALGGDDDTANRLLDKLAGKQQPDGSLEGAITSIVGSGGDALKIEATSLAAMAWLKNARYTGNVERAIKFLAETCKAGRFGSTQSTVLALRAIVAYDQSRARPKAPGYLQLIVDGGAVGQPVEFTTEDQGAIELPDATPLLTPGKHTIAVKMTDGSTMPYSIAANYNTLKPNSSRDCKLHLECKLRDTQIDEGAVTEANVVVVNRTGEVVPSTVAIIGVPGGLEVRHDQLKELVKAGRIAAYEVIGRDVVLYWRSLAAEQRIELPISLVAAIPGSYTGPASRAYLYYTDEHKQWNDGLAVEITPRAAQ